MKWLFPAAFIVVCGVTAIEAQQKHLFRLRGLPSPKRTASHNASHTPVSKNGQCRMMLRLPIAS